MKKLWQAADRWVTDVWNWEILSLAFALTCLAAIVGLLFSYDNSVFPDLPQGVTLNTVVSFLASGAKAGLLTAVAASFAQWKWLQLDASRNRRSLYEMQVLDDAGRGPWGALMVIFRTHNSIIIVVGAVVTILTLAFEAFVQQTIAYRNEVVYELSDSATMPFASTFDLDLANPKSAADISVARTVLRGAFTSQDVGLPQTVPRCQSGNCTWDNYEVLGLCSQCLDVTKNAVDNVRCKENLGCKQYLVDGSDPYILWDGSDPIGSPAWSGILVDSKLSNWTARTDSSMPDPLFTMEAIWYGFYGVPRLALECSVTFCVRRRSAASRNGELSTKEMSFTIPQPRPSTLTTNASRSFENNWALGHQPGKTSRTGFNVGNSSAWTMRALLIDTFLRYNIAYVWQDIVLFDGGLPEDDVELLMNSTTDFPALLDRTALAVTNFMQNISTTTIQGSAGALQNRVKVRWPWIAYPLTVFALAVGFLLSTIFVTRSSKMVIWKTSIPALLYHGLDKVPAGVGDMQIISEMEGHADSVQGRLGKTVDGWKILLVGRAPSVAASSVSASPTSVTQAQPVATSSAQPPPTPPTPPSQQQQPQQPQPAPPGPVATQNSGYRP